MNPEDHWEAFGKWLRAQRVARGMSRARLQEMSGVSVSQQRHYEDGRRLERGRVVLPNPQEVTLHRLAEALGVPKREICRRAGVECTAPRPLPPDDRDLALAEELERMEESARRLHEEVKGLRRRIAQRLRPRDR